MTNVKFTESTRSEVKKDILELESKINAFQIGAIPEDKFKHFRLTRGVYGQRQTGVQMVRIKLPYGKVTSEQLITIANVSDKYATGNLHLTTRQDIQLHYVKVADTPQLWSDLEQAQITLREACGNTVRNVTASAFAGIDPDEPFDVSPYAHALAYFFLRNPICQDMGRKFKIAFSSSERDSAYTFIHDIGFIPRIKNQKKGFKVVIGGGLGAQSFSAQTAFEFLPADQYIPFAESIIRVFDRFGERERRNKARFKFLLKSLGLQEILRLAEAERKALKSQSFVVEESTILKDEVVDHTAIQEVLIPEEEKNNYEKWLKANVFKQKQVGFYAIGLQITNGDIHSDTARALAQLVKEYAADDIRVTMNQGLLLKNISAPNLPFWFTELKKIGLAKSGFDTIYDVTTCPGTDTCNLGVTNSMTLAKVIENLLREDYPELVDESAIKIKMSGCMNACGQHMAANIGFSGSSIKVGNLVIPAMQVILGGGVDPKGNARIGDKVVKIPTKRIPKAIKIILDDFANHSIEGEYFNDYYSRQEERYFYHKLKPLSDPALFTEDDYIDWGHQENYVQEIGVGECAGVILDVIGTIIKESEERLQWAKEGLEEVAYPDAIYNAYSSMIISAKALLLSEDKHCNTQMGIIHDFDKNFYKTKKIILSESFEEYILKMNKNEPSKEFAESYLTDAHIFLQKAIAYRNKQIAQDKSIENKTIVDSHYKA